jgi:hypothetical protein
MEAAICNCASVGLTVDKTPGVHFNLPIFICGAVAQLARERSRYVGLLLRKANMNELSLWNSMFYIPK